MHVLLMILAFMCWWPLGLLALGFLIARRRYGYAYGSGYCARRVSADDSARTNRSFRMERWERKMARAEERVDRVRAKVERFMGGGSGFRASSSGNSAFDDYRTQTLRRLEDEQHEFQDFLERLRFAKDRSEFDQFMAERRRAAAAEPDPRNDPPTIDPTR